MRPLILSALLLAAAAPALAQEPPPDRRDEYRQHDDRGQRGGDRHDERGYRGDDRGYRADDRGFRGGERGDDRREWRGDDRRDWRGDDRGGWRGDGDRGWRDDRRFGDDRRGYGDGDRFARFHTEPFYYPRGWSYRYYGVGTYLPRVFWDQRYYIVQPDYYRLPPPFIGTHWVRYGPDALLVRNYDGRIVRVIRGLFY